LPSSYFLALLVGFVFLCKAPSILGGINDVIILAEIDKVEVAHVPMTALAWLHLLLLGVVCIIRYGGVVSFQTTQDAVLLFSRCRLTLHNFSLAFIELRVVISEVISLYVRRVIKRV